MSNRLARASYYERQPVPQIFSPVKNKGYSFTATLNPNTMRFCKSFPSGALVVEWHRKEDPAWASPLREADRRQALAELLAFVQASK